MTDFPPPQAFGLPEKFCSWRVHQAEAISRAISTEKRIVVPVCPTGSGKSVQYVTSAIMQGGRAVFLTSTKGLQTQLMRDFGPIGMVDIRGRNSYPCAMAKGEVNCDAGPCIAGVKCPLKNTDECEYYRAVNQARRAKLVVTNYSYWLYSNKYADGLGPVDYLVCDEGHDAPNAISDFLTISLDKTDHLLHTLLPSAPQEYTMNQWARWADQTIETLQEETDLLADKVRWGDNRAGRRLAKVSRILQDIKRLAHMDTENWVVETAGSFVQFSPIWTNDFAQDALFMDIPHIMVTSASVRKKTLEMLGVRDDDMDLYEFPSSFPKENRQLIHLPTARINYRTTQEHMNLWLRRIDQILRPRQDRKGIIHTTSYARRDLIMANSEFAYMMLTHDSKNTVSRVQQFKNSDVPLILVSPSVTTGWDFPYDTTRFQILGKVPYPDTRSKIIKARMEADKDYAPYIAMQQLMQTVGRGVRAEDDWAETFIIDDNIQWFLKRYQSFATEWFMEAYSSRMAAPPPPPLD